MHRLRYLLITILVAMSATSFGQALLPTSWGFDGAAPNGWTLSGTDYFTSSTFSNFAIPSCKLNSTGDYVQIDLAEEPGNLTYYVMGSGSGPWQGTFSVQESSDGSMWTDVRVFNNGDIDVNGFTSYTDNLDPATRYVRFYYTNKVSGNNTALDDVSIDPPTAGAEQEINITDIQGNSIPTGGITAISSPVGVAAPLSLIIENLGTSDTLFITGAMMSGPAAGDFFPAGGVSSVLPQSADTLVFNFTPAAAGTREASVSISNNDMSENPYVVNLYGVGGDFATEPANQPTNLVFNNVTAYGAEVLYTGNGADGYMVLRKNGSAVTAAPVDGVSYDVGEGLGDAKVFYFDENTSFDMREVIADQTYHFAVFAYNGFGPYINYQQMNPLTNTMLSDGNDPGSYYASVNSTQSSFVSDLTNLINPHTQIFYSNYRQTYVADFAARDTTGEQEVVTCRYSGEEKVYTIPFDFSAVGVSREHTFPNSWMPTDGDDDTDEFSDQHNLIPVNQVQVNDTRSNYPLGEVVSVIQSFEEGKFGDDADGNRVYEPRDEYKGDAARSIMYMMTCYHMNSGGSWALDDLGTRGPDQDQDVLKAWHWQDPPSAIEIAKNEYVHSLQNNRNPFIDSMHYACRINFRDMSYIAGSVSVPCDTTPEGNDPGLVTSPEKNTFELAPNPTNEKFSIYWSKAIEGEQTVDLLDVSGRKVQSWVVLPSSAQRAVLSLNENVVPGSYTVRVTDEHLQTTVRQLIIH